MDKFGRNVCFVHRMSNITYIHVTHIQASDYRVFWYGMQRLILLDPFSVPFGQTFSFVIYANHTI